MCVWKITPDEIALKKYMFAPRAVLHQKWAEDKSGFGTLESMIALAFTDGFLFSDRLSPHTFDADPRGTVLGSRTYFCDGFCWSQSRA